MVPMAAIGQGKLEGASERGVSRFLGIPFAKPPVGPLRFRPPQRPDGWSGARDATRFGPASHQASRPLAPILGMVLPAQSEDCLYLNVWTAVPPGAAPRPVMVFFHGGGNSLWSGSMLAFDGSHLARKGAVVVTLNFRLGPFGFLAHPELDTESPNHVSRNYGLLDQQAALLWVKTNIAAFGGDPERITIFGQSAGGTDVGYAMASPLAKGLFRRAIIESSAMFGTEGPTPNLASAEEGGKKLVTELGAPSIAALRAPSVGVTPSAHYLRCRLHTPTGSRHSPIASKGARQLTRSKPSSIST